VTTLTGDTWRQLGAVTPGRASIGSRILEGLDVVFRVSVTADGTGVVAHAGSVAVHLLADRTGLTGELSKVLAGASFTPVTTGAGFWSTWR
jgi:hypothetical protein